MDLLDKKISRNEAIAWRTIEGEALLVSSKDGLLYPLNHAGTRVWELADGQKTCRDIIAIIDEEFETDTKDLREDIFGFIEDLIKKELAFAA